MKCKMKNLKTMIYNKETKQLEAETHEDLELMYRGEQDLIDLQFQEALEKDDNYNN